MSSPLMDSHMLPFAHFDSYATSTEEEVIAPLEAPKPIVASAPKRKNKVTKKRKRVGRACVFCQRSHMSCDEQRPCKRCVGRGCGDQCRDGKRKRRGRKRKTPLPDDENSIDDEFDEFEPVDKMFKDDSDTEEDLEDDHAHCNHTADGGDHHHHHAAPAANHGDIQLFEDDEEENSSLSHSSSSVPFMKIKTEFEEEMAAPSRPTTPAIPVPLRNPRLTIISQAPPPQEESASPSSNHPNFESVYPSFFESHHHATSSETSAPAHQQAASSSIDVDSFFAAEPGCGGSRMAPLAYFENHGSFGEQADACF